MLDCFQFKISNFNSTFIILFFPVEHHYGGYYSQLGYGQNIPEIRKEMEKRTGNSSLAALYMR